MNRLQGIPLGLPNTMLESLREVLVKEVMKILR